MPKKVCVCTEFVKYFHFSLREWQTTKGKAGLFCLEPSLLLCLVGRLPSSLLCPLPGQRLGQCQAQNWGQLCVSRVALVADTCSRPWEGYSLGKSRSPLPSGLQRSSPMAQGPWVRLPGETGSLWCSQELLEKGTQQKLKRLPSPVRELCFPFLHAAFQLWSAA